MLVVTPSPPPPLGSTSGSTLVAGINACTSTIRGAAQASNGMLVGSVDPWLRVDLGTAGAVWDGVQFFSRTDCEVSNPSNVFGSIDCQTRNSGFQIAYGDDGSAFNSPNNYQPYTPGFACGSLPPDLLGGNAFVSCPRAVGRYVWVYLPGANRVLSVCELQVLRVQPWTWRMLSGGAGATVEIAQGKHAQQSSVFYDGQQGTGSDARLAVDGVTGAGTWFSGSCAHTDVTTGAGATQRVSFFFSRGVATGSVRWCCASFTPTDKHDEVLTYTVPPTPPRLLSGSYSSSSTLATRTTCRAWRCGRSLRTRSTRAAQPHSAT